MARDEHIYAYVMNEFENGIKDDLLYIKAYTKSERFKQKIKPLYMQYSVNL
jgi:hypothetical protein